MHKKQIELNMHKKHCRIFPHRLQHHHLSRECVSRETAGGFGAVRASLVMEVSVQTTHSLQTAFYNMDLPPRVSAFNSMSMTLDSWDMAFQGYEIAGIDQICKLFATKINSTWGGEYPIYGRILQICSDTFPRSWQHLSLDIYMA